jgi:hypothetical protein
MMAGYAFHVSNFHTLLIAGFNRRFLSVPFFLANEKGTGVDSDAFL